jgi:hypothetical protein
MRVLLNGRDVGSLDGGLERRLWGRVSGGVVDGVAISPEQSIAARAGQLRLMLGGAAALVAVLLALNLMIVMTKAPQAGEIVLVVVGIAIVITGALVSLLYVLMLGAHRRRVEGRGEPGLASGTEVHLDIQVLRVGGAVSPWSSLQIEEVGIRERQGNERRVTFIEQLTLNDGARTLRLDALFLTNGRAVLEQAWLRTRAATGQQPR